MLRKFGSVLLCAGALLSTNTSAMTHNIKPGVSIDYELPPGDPQIFANYWFWSVTATCSISGKDPSNDIFAEVLNKKGSINGNAVSAGDTLMMTVRPGDKLVISADSGARVQLTNRGRNTIVAKCST